MRTRAAPCTSPESPRRSRRPRARPSAGGAASRASSRRGADSLELDPVPGPADAGLGRGATRASRPPSYAGRSSFIRARRRLGCAIGASSLSLHACCTRYPEASSGSLAGRTSAPIRLSKLLEPGSAVREGSLAWWFVDPVRECRFPHYWPRLPLNSREFGGADAGTRRAGCSMPPCPLSSPATHASSGSRVK